jgi:hypothetical protein
MMAKKAEEQPKAEAPKVEQPKQDDTPQGKTIDERMADLLADHKKMGAR